MTLDLAKLRAETLALLDGTTPWPWVARKAGTFWDIVDQSGRDIVTVYGGGVPDEHKDANARLIAAAPTLAADTLRLLDEIERLRGLVEEAVQIFENCSVESGVCGCGDDMRHHPSPMDCGHTPTDLGGYEASRWLTAARAALAEGGPDGR